MEHNQVYLSQLIHFQRDIVQIKSCNVTDFIN